MRIKDLKVGDRLSTQQPDPWKMKQINNNSVIVDEIKDNWVKYHWVDKLFQVRGESCLQIKEFLTLYPYKVE